jgi:hypothetical protein
MSKKKAHLLFYCLALSLLMMGCFPPEKVAALQTKAVTDVKGLTLSPIRRELEIEPGRKSSGKLTVVNSTSWSMTINMSAEEFNVINQQYDYAFNGRSDVVKWVTFESDKIILKAGESKKVAYDVSVPLSVEPGGRYISIFASTNINVHGEITDSYQRVASLLYVTVLGNVTRTGRLLSLSSPWVMDDNSQWSVTLQNTGTTHYISRYSAQVCGLIGSEAVASMSGETLMLPKTVRLVTDTIPTPEWPGVYKIIYTVGLGDTPARIETRVIIYMPSSIMIMFLVVIVIVVILVASRRAKER